MSRVLLTGGGGFIGSHIADALLEAGHQVRVLDWLHPAAHADRGRPADLPAAVDFRRGDVREASDVVAALAGVDHVCHQAAMVGLGTDILDIADYVAHNDLGTAVLLRELARARFGGRLVQASSMVVYGEGRYRCAEHGETRPPARTTADLDAGRFEPACPRCGAPLEPLAIPEDAPVDPRNVYAATKLQQELLAVAFSRETGIPVTSLRYHNVYGPRMPRDTPYAGVASIFVSALNAGQAPRVFEDGRQLRDFVHVRDVARANVLALTAAEPVPGAFNVCSGVPRSVGEMAHALHAAGFGGVPAPRTTGAYRLGDVRHVFADPARATARLGFTAREDFAAGMAEFAAAPPRAEPVPAG
ncbi:NAD-dependent epimerase/dehydratase family protein [Paraconexibacter antarcticus]|uniref:NAD-dependent epimerase/dehydratase family protein n=1 Tax=Paraconexibacter antarcticus TaxID=2949664 RepID=A0ABY5DXS8_9ACTN|nr:NAD-dependent epimerase/dehydratase family protein [Paraconexibacter antarcticus]UTI66833.1 NAD-dependent epimerase/dehydratase family protein [Paraconexibacter antarcticus]